MQLRRGELGEFSHPFSALGLLSSRGLPSPLQNSNVICLYNS